MGTEQGLRAFRETEGLAGLSGPGGPLYFIPLGMGSPEKPVKREL